MKKYLVATIVCSAIILSGCQSNKNKEESNNNFSQDKTEKTLTSDKGIGKTTVIDGVEISVSNLQNNSISNDKGKKSLCSIEVKGKNISSFTKGLGAIDFKLVTTDGKRHDVSNNYNVFGSEIDTDKDIKGTLYFELSDKETPSKLEYTPNDKALMIWNLE